MVNKTPDKEYFNCVIQSVKQLSKSPKKLYEKDVYPNVSDLKLINTILV